MLGGKGYFQLMYSFIGVVGTVYASRTPGIRRILFSTKSWA